MLDDDTIRRTALFFFFSIENELVAWEAAKSTLGHIQSLLKKSKEISPEIVLVRMSFKNWEKYQKAKAGKNQNLEGDLAFQLPDGVDLGAWRQFAKDADREELLAVIWSKILKLSDEVIAAGIHVTPGTVRHRVGRGLRLLGELKMY